jgi:hypothetical protein
MYKARHARGHNRRIQPLGQSKRQIPRPDIPGRMRALPRFIQAQTVQRRGDPVAGMLAGQNNRRPPGKAAHFRRGPFLFGQKDLCNISRHVFRSLQNFCFCQENFVDRNNRQL